MRDPAGAVRRKSRLIAEIRYPAAPRIFDIRGKLINQIHPQVTKDFKHWRSDSAGVVFTNDLETPSQEFVISLKRTAVALEDTGSIQEFVDRTKKYLGLMHDVMGDSIVRLLRVGVRFVEICAPDRESSFEAMNELVISKLTQAPEDMQIEAVDSLVRIIHKHGMYHVGPLRENEPWIEQMFRDPVKNVPKAGIGIDIDSYLENLEGTGREEIRQAFVTVYEVSKAIEESLLRHFGMVDG
jgi:hypothetical protein